MPSPALPLHVILLAAGKGTRMRSQLAKVLHPIGGTPMVKHVVNRAQELQAQAINVVVGHGSTQVEEALADSGARFVTQTEQLGTGHAVQQALPHIQPESAVLILYGDVPLIRSETLRKLADLVNSESMGLLTGLLDNPFGYGRIVRNAQGVVQAIVEEKDASDEQRKIREINSGVMAVKGSHLLEWLPALSNNNAQGEYYLTDIIAMAAKAGVRVGTVCTDDLQEIAGVNNRQQQAQLERAFQLRQADSLMAAGLTLIDPTRFDLRGSLTTGTDCTIDINCLFEGNVELGNDVVIGPNCCIKNAKIADGTEIYANSIIEDAIVGAHCHIGPFARLRPGTELAEAAKIGNFVETKKARVGKGSKVNHLSYVGDATLGAGVNVGAGTITCNYDGVNKHQTVIGDGVFVGSNTALVAPVHIAAQATIAAGSTVTSDVGEQQLGVARSRQRNIDGWQRPTKKTKD